MGMVILRRGNQLYNINILIYYDNDYLAFFLMTETTVINISISIHIHIEYNMEFCGSLPKHSS